MLLSGKKILVLGFASKRSIAFGIACSLAEHGAEIVLSVANDKLAQRAKLDCEHIPDLSIYTLDVSEEKNIENAMQAIHKDHPIIDGIVHAVAYAPKESLQGHITDNLTSEGFHSSLNISVYSFLKIAKFAPQLMPNGGSMCALSYIGANQAFPGYNLMGIAKASLEASIRYLALDMGKYQIRVNGISAGPIRTLASSAIGDFRNMLDHSDYGRIDPLARRAAEVGLFNLFRQHLCAG